MTPTWRIWQAFYGEPCEVILVDFSRISPRKEKLLPYEEWSRLLYYNYKRRKLQENKQKQRRKL